MTQIERIYNRLEEIQELSCQYSMIKIATMLELPYTTMTIICKNEGIHPPKAVYTKIYKNSAINRRAIIDKNELKQLYITQEKSIFEIVKILGYNQATIHKYLKKFNIITRKKNGLDNILSSRYEPEIYYNLYYNQKKSLHEMARILGYNHGSGVAYDMDKCGISRRNLSNAGKTAWKTNEAFRESSLKGLKKCREGNPSSYEFRFLSWCEENSIKNIQQYVIANSGLIHPYDFYLPKYHLIVEIDGVYWHSLEQSLQNDIIYNRVAKEFGYNLIRITDIEIKKCGTKIFDERVKQYEL